VLAAQLILAVGPTAILSIMKGHAPSSPKILEQRRRGPSNLSSCYYHFVVDNSTALSRQVFEFEIAFGIGEKDLLLRFANHFARILVLAQPEKNRLP